MKFSISRKARALLLALAGALLFSQAFLAAESLTVLLTKDALWSYLDNGQDLGTAWRAAGFDDSSWKKGKAPLGYGDDFSETEPTLALATPVEFGKSDNKYMTTYFRSSFTVADPAAFKEIEVYIHVDDGAVVYVNGTEAFRRGVEDKPVVYSSPGKFKPKEETFRLPVSFLKAGKNSVAAEVHQDGPDSSDLWFELSFKGVSEGGSAVSVQQATPTKPWTLVADPTAPLGSVSKLAITMGPDAATSRGFAWYTTRASIASDLQMVEIPAGKAKSAPDFTKAVVYRGRTSESAESMTELAHKVEVTGLKPGTRYAFRAGDAKAGLWSSTGTFTTASETGGFTFIDIADTQAKTEDEAELSSQTLDKALAMVPNASFIALNGDLVDTGANEKQWDWFLGKSGAALSNMTFVPAAGNHEEDASSFASHFALPISFGSTAQNGAYYSFNQQNAHFIVLNNNEDSPEYANFTPAQISWLKADAALAKKNGAVWLIVIMHKGPYTTSNHATDSDIMGPKGVRTLVAPIFSDLNVDLVLQGHDHIYARSFPIANGKTVKAPLKKENFQGSSVEYMMNPKGTVYLIPGTAGPKVYYRNKKIDPAYYNLFAVADENHAAVYGPDPADTSRPLRGVIQNFAVFTVEGKKLTAVVYEIDQKKNSGQPYVIDRFGIIK